MEAFITHNNTISDQSVRNKSHLVCRNHLTYHSLESIRKKLSNIVVNNVFETCGMKVNHLRENYNHNQCLFLTISIDRVDA